LKASEILLNGLNEASAIIDELEATLLAQEPMSSDPETQRLLVGDLEVRTASSGSGFVKGFCNLQNIECTGVERLYENRNLR
jgi:hypothetical protein